MSSVIPSAKKSCSTSLILVRRTEGISRPAVGCLNRVYLETRLDLSIQMAAPGYPLQSCCRTHRRTRAPGATCARCHELCACLLRLAAVPRELVVPWEGSVAPFETLNVGKGALTHES